MARSDRSAGRKKPADLVPMWGVLLGLAVALLPAVAGVSYLPKWTGELWSYATADECPARAPAADCVIRVPGEVKSRTTIEGTGQNSSDEADIYVTLDRDMARGSPDIPGFVTIEVTPGEADDLGIIGSVEQGERVTVTLFRQQAIEITGPSGETASKNNSPTVQFAATFALTVVFVMVSFAGLVYLWRRVRLYGMRSRFPGAGEKPFVPMPGWLIPTGICVGVSTVAAVLFGWLAVLLFSDAVLVPVVFGVTVVGSIVLGVCYRVLSARARVLWHGKPSGRHGRMGGTAGPAKS
ncbi:hypothetical protein [Actinophytocola sp.]|uniref:hypothetical protein n=1 Tax=Actinophytocola sp. TaxID=1872138 RepID=UPI003D6BAB05